jgi:hypothetical protein
MQSIPYLCVVAIVLMLDLIVLEGKGTVVAIQSAKQATVAVASTLTAPLR